MTDFLSNHMIPEEILCRSISWTGLFLHTTPALGPPGGSFSSREEKTAAFSHCTFLLQSMLAKMNSISALMF